MGLAACVSAPSVGDDADTLCLRSGAGCRLPGDRL